MSSAEKQAIHSSSSSVADSDEKARSVRVERVLSGDEDVESPRLKTNIYNEHVDVSGIDEKKLMRKLDWWLVPWLSFLYLLSFLDRTSIGNAKVRQRAPQAYAVTANLILLRNVALWT